MIHQFVFVPFKTNTKKCICPNWFKILKVKGMILWSELQIVPNVIKPLAYLLTKNDDYCNYLYII